MQNISKIRTKLNELSGVYKNEITNLARYEKELILIDTDLEDHKKVREVYQQAAIFTQKYLEEHISSIVTNALKSVFYEKDIEFKVKFDKKRNSSECSLYILEDGEEYDILDDKGFGVADIASFALRVAYILLDSVDNVLIMDEPFRNLDKDRTPYASRMIAELSKKLNIQFIIVSHVEDLIESADKVITLRLKKKDVTEVVE